MCKSSYINFVQASTMQWNSGSFDSSDNCIFTKRFFAIWHSKKF